MSLLLCLLLAFVPFLQQSAARECFKGCKCAPDPIHPASELLICDFSPETPPLFPIATVYSSSNNVRSLFMSCQGGIKIPETFFKGLSSLQHLKLEGCYATHLATKIFEDLTSIRTIEMSRMTPKGVAFELTEDVLLPLTRVEKFAVTESNPLILPNNLLCSLPHLQVLNVSSNGLEKLHRKDDCIAQQLIIFDGSNNSLENLESFLAGAPALRQLSLSHNSIQYLSLPAAATPFIQQLDVENNNILAVLNELPETIVHANLASNKLRAVPDAIYALPGLVALNISGNSITSTNVSSFESRDLESLDASSNSLASLPVEWLKNCESTIVHLRLRNNQIDEIGPRSFANSTKLNTLDLSSNRIRVLADESLSGASKLSSLLLANNSLEVLEPMSLAEMNLDVLDVSHNALTEIPAAVGRLAKLKKIDVSHNKISKLYQYVVNKLKNLHSIDISHNELQSIGPFVFSDSAELTSLDLSHNQISTLFKDSFVKCPKLKRINLSYNRLNSLDEGFSQVSGLRRLDVSHNVLQLLQWTMLPSQIEVLLADHNQISLLGAAGDSMVKSVSLIGNRIAQLSADQLPNKVEFLELENNTIRHIAKGTFAAKTSLRKVCLANNQLTIVEAEALKVIESVHFLRISLANNPLQCSCEMTWLVPSKAQETAEKQVRVTIEDVSTATCRHSIDGRVLRVDQLVMADMLCKYNQVCEPECVCCQYGNCDCKSVCPAQCRCFRDANFELNVVRCEGSANNDTIQPQREFVVSSLPVHATDIVLSGVALPQLRTHAFIGRLRLQRLHINATGLRSIQPKAFHSLPKLKTIDLSDNSLFSLSGDEFLKTNEVAQLFLNGNKMNTLNRAIFEKMPNLQFLTLHNNSFEDIPASLSQVPSSLRALTLSGNPLRCDCASAGDSADMAHRRAANLPEGGSTAHHNAAEWMHANRAMVSDAARVECVENVTRAFRENDTTVLSAYPPNRHYDVFVMPMDVFLRDYNVSICVPFSSGFFGQDPQNSILFVLFAIACSFLLCALVLLGISLVRKTHNAMNQRRYKTSSLNCSTTAGSSPLPLPLISYHAFVSYSKRDEKMVIDELCRPLEDEDYQLCLLHRDGPVYNSAVHAISDELIAQMEASQSLVVVLTRHFLENEWKTLQIKTSHQLFAKNRTKRLIAIVADDVDKNLIDDELGLILRKSERVELRNPLFWQLLHSALPNRLPPPPSGSDSLYSDVYGIVPSAII